MADRVDHRKHLFVGSHDLSQLKGKVVANVWEYHRFGETGDEVQRTSLLIHFVDWTELLLIDTGRGLQVELGVDLFQFREKRDLAVGKQQS